jgi:tetratricopeptide (TPR) repeat protein
MTTHPHSVAGSPAVSDPHHARRREGGEVAPEWLSRLIYPAVETSSPVDPGAFRDPKTGFLGRIAIALCIVMATCGLGHSVALAQGHEVESSELEGWSRQRLASSFASFSSSMLQSKSSVSIPEVRMALELAIAGVRSDPDSIPAWRWMLELSTSLSDDMPIAEAMKRESVQALVRLDPDDEVVRLLLLVDRIESRTTVQARINACEVLLQPENIKRLGAPAAARIALDLSRLETMSGRFDAASRWLAEAITLDPAFPEAMKQALEMFGGEFQSPAANAELLAAAFTADPRKGAIANSLGSLALQHGAYAAASEVLESAILLSHPMQPGYLLLATNESLALWGEGKSETALRTIATRTRSITQVFKQLRIRGADFTEMQRDQLSAMVLPPPPSLALLRAVIIAQQGTENARDEAVDVLFQAFDFAISENTRKRSELTLESEQLDANNIDSDEQERENTQKQNAARQKGLEAQLAGLWADEAWARAWFGWSPPAPKDGAIPRASLEKLLEVALESGSLNAEQGLIIEGWSAISGKRFDEARLLLTPIAEVSVYAAAGIALIDELGGQTKEAARGYRDVYYGRPGELVGLWCRSRLSKILKSEIPVPPAAGPVQAAIDATLPRAVGMAVQDRERGVIALEVKPRKLRFEPYEPVIIDVKITNLSGITLAIEPGGPLSPRIALSPIDVTIPGMQKASKQLVVSIQRRLQLLPQQSLTCSVDLSATWMASILDQGALFGGGLAVRVANNFMARSDVQLTPNLFGREKNSSPFFIVKQSSRRMEGEEPDEGSKSRLPVPRTVADLKALATLFGRLLTTNLEVSDEQTTREEKRQIYQAVLESFKQLPISAQSWFLAVVPRNSSEFLDPFVEIALESGDPAAILVSLARFANFPSARPITVAISSGDESLVRAGTAVREFIVARFKQEEKDLELPPG